MYKRQLDRCARLVYREYIRGGYRGAPPTLVDLRRILLEQPEAEAVSYTHLIILLGWGVVQVGLSFQSHDPSQRSQGFLTLAGGLVITFAREILALIGVA